MFVLGASGGVGTCCVLLAKLVGVASSYSCNVFLARHGREVNAKSIMGVMMLAASRGTELVIHASGEDEKEAVNSLEKLIADRFGENE